MSQHKVAAWSHAEEFVTPSDHIEAAHRRAEELGVDAIGNGAGGFLRAIAAATGAKAVMEVGTGTGVSGLWILGGMPPDGILTTIDIEAEHQQAAREAFAAAGIAHQRTRVIAGRALEVLVLLVDDLVDSGWTLTVASRLLRHGGTLVLTWTDKESDPAARDPETRTLREVGKLLRDHDEFTASLLPVGDGLLIAVKR